MYILGLNIHHADSSASLLLDGELICATEEERFTRIKHWAGFPKASIDFCLEFAGIELGEVDHVVIGRDPNAKLLKKVIYSIKRFGQIKGFLRERIYNRQNISSIDDLFIQHYGFKPSIHYVEHHRAHLASAFFASPFEEATLVSLDGSGDFSTVMVARAEGNSIEVLDSVDFPVSLGIIYTAFTQYLGFPYYGDEYKVMGLSPYGKPTLLQEMEDIFDYCPENILRWNEEFFNLSNGAIRYVDGVPEVPVLFSSKLTDKFGSPRKKGDDLTSKHKDIASSLQRHVENVIFKILNHAYDLSHSANLCIAGGVAQNSVANGKILTNTKFTNLYVPSAGHDAGISMGAAQYFYFVTLKKPKLGPIYNANLGIEFTNDEIKLILESKGLKYSFLDDTKLFDYIAQSISNRKVVGFFDGRAEFGPRALGSRSILADPRDPKAQELLNLKIKKRESFRPFAPSILEEYGNEYFENYQFTPFMERVLKIKESKRNLIPAVTHVDGTGRLQSVSQEQRPRYYQLIKSFYEHTGVPILINTSFNENEPVVNIPEHAIATYERTDLDILVLGNFVLEK